jgi:methyl-accepting chemotaxis protein
MKWSVGTKIGAGFGLAIAILIALGAVTYRTTSQLEETSNLESHSKEVLKMLEDLSGDATSIESAERGYIMTGQEQYFDAYRKKADEVARKTKNLRRLVGDSPTQLRRLDNVELLTNSRVAFAKGAIDVRRSEGVDAAVKRVLSDNDRKVSDDMQEAIEEMISEEENTLTVRKQDADASASRARYAIVLGVLFSFAGLTSGGVVITRNIARPLKEISLTAERVAAGDLTVNVSANGRGDEVGLLNRTIMVMVDNLRKNTLQIQEATRVLASSATEILASVTHLTSGAAETATAVTETATTVEEVKQTAQVSNQKAKYVSDSAQKAVQVSRAGETSVSQTVEGMDRIREQMESIAESIVRLSEQSQAIGEIISSVNDLAEQSNLLAVNASIEAARAGDQGKGFAVVAQEVKTLAEQSKHATGQVRTILSDIQKATGAAVLAIEQGGKAVEAGVKQSTEAGTSIQSLAKSVAEAAQAALQIAASSQQQLTGVDQVTLAMDNIKQASVQNVESMKQVEVAAQNLNELGQKLREIVGEYRV